MRRRVPRSPMGSPSSHASPEVGLRRPSSSLTDVVLPAPLGPRKPKISPRGTVIDRPESATVLPNRLVRSTVWMAGAAAATPFSGVATTETGADSATKAGYLSRLLQIARDIHRDRLLDGAGDHEDVGLVDPDHSGAEASVVPERYARVPVDAHLG